MHSCPAIEGGVIADEHIMPHRLKGGKIGHRVIGSDDRQAFSMSTHIPTDT